MKLTLSSCLCLVLAIELLSLGECLKTQRPGNVGFLIGYLCPTLPPSIASLLSEEELAEDVTCRDTLVTLTMEQPAGLQDLKLDTLKGSDILNLLSENNYREETCVGFNQVADCVDPYFQRRSSCLGRHTPPAQIRLLTGVYRTLCMDDFENILTDVLSSVGDDCINTLVQKDTVTKKLINPTCKETQGQVNRGIRNGEEFATVIRRELPIILEKCVLDPVEDVCGSEARTQFQRITDLYLQNAFL